MGVSEVVSPISRKGSKVGSGQPLSPGARSNPGRSDQAASAAPPQPSQAKVSLGEERTGASVTVVGPEGPEE